MASTMACIFMKTHTTDNFVAGRKLKASWCSRDPLRNRREWHRVCYYFLFASFHWRIATHTFRMVFDGVGEPTIVHQRNSLRGKLHDENHINWSRFNQKTVQYVACADSSIFRNPNECNICAWILVAATPNDTLCQYYTFAIRRCSGWCKRIQPFPLQMPSDQSDERLYQRNVWCRPQCAGCGARWSRYQCIHVEYVNKWNQHHFHHFRAGWMLWIWVAHQTHFKLPHTCRLTFSIQ